MSPLNPSVTSTADILRAAREHVLSSRWAGAESVAAIVSVIEHDKAGRLFRKAMFGVRDPTGSKARTLDAFDRAIALAEQAVQS